MSLCIFRICSNILLNNILIFDFYCRPGQYGIAFETDNLENHDGSKVRHITFVMIHPGYNPLTLVNDIALICWRDAIQFNDKVSVSYFYEH